jgi:uncharacterized membrane protein YkoI
MKSTFTIAIRQNPFMEVINMKKVNKLSKVLCALGVSTVLFAGVATAATYPAPSSWDGVGSVASPMQSSEIDYVGAVTTLHRYYPDAMITSISYDAKHHPTYEVEAYTKTQKVKMKIDEATGQVVSNEAKSLGYWNRMKKAHSFNPQNTITPEAAETRAIERVGSDFQTMEWELEMEGNKVVYDLEMTNGGDKKADVKIDALSGKVLSAKVKTTKY